MRNLFEILKKTFSINPSEHLAVNEVIVLFKGRVIFRQYIPKKRKRFGIKIYELCDGTVYTYDMTVYSFLHGGEEISYRNSRFILVNDILETMEQVGRHE
jgi:hypothetical protein